MDEIIAKVKKLTTLFLIVVLCFSFVSCSSKKTNNNNNDTQPVENENVVEEETPQLYKLGDTVSTDIFEFTLNAAEFTIALNNVNDDDYYTPKEYNPEEDADNPYVAAIGHTYAAFSYTVTNLNRASCEFHNGSSGFVSVQYDGNSYSSFDEGAYFIYTDKTYIDTNGSMQTKKPGEWRSSPSSNLRLGVGEKETRRAYVDLNVDIKDLDADVQITFSIPNSDGTKTEFIYLVTETDRNENKIPEIEMSLELALCTFIKQESRDYFTSHIDEYAVVSGDQIANIVSGKWNVVYIAEGGYWSGTFWFEADGRIKDTYGYVNERTWSLSGDTLIIDGEKNCEMRKVTDEIYLLLSDGKPYLLMQ